MVAFIVLNSGECSRPFLRRRGKKSGTGADPSSANRSIFRSVFGGSDDSPWNIEDNERCMLMKQARIDKLKAEADAAKSGGKGVVVEEVKEKEVELKKPDRVFW